MNTILKRNLHLAAHIIHNCIHLIVNSFQHVQTVIEAILSRYNSNESFKPASCASSEYQILARNAFNRDKVHFTETTLLFQASEKIHFIESDNQNGTRSGILERSLCLEMNKTEFLSEGSE